MYDFKHIVDFIFKNKDDYKKLSDEDKKKFFFIINRKLARLYPYHAQYVNKKGINEASALDLWYYFFIKKRTMGVPKWYWFKLSSTNKEKPTKYKTEEIDFIKQFYDIDNYGIEYLIQHHPSELEEEIIKYRKFNKNGKT